MVTKISSFQNIKIKSVIRLYTKPKERKETGLFIVEGNKEIDFALACGYEVTDIFFCPEKITLNELNSIKNKAGSDAGWYEITPAIMQKVAYRDTVVGIIAIFKEKQRTLNAIKLKNNPLLLVIDGIEKPGNIGALLRTADGAGVDAVLICAPKTDLYNPNIIRSSVGCIFGVQIALCDYNQAIQWLKQNVINIFVATPKAALHYTKINFTEPCAIIVGSEDKGVNQVWLQHSTQNISIQMHGINDSLNVSASAAIIIYEALRQRNS
ncbi:MAG: RNA methyltransferase [Bacteroidia bacterium]|nr:RNA methyltransferase [Bacteroidia bacterium]